MKVKRLLTLLLVVLSIAMFSCKKDGASTTAEGGGSNPSNPANCEDPEGTITANLRNDDGSITILDAEMKINAADNFYGTGDGIYSSITYNMTFVNIGGVEGLGCINALPQSGWSNQVSVIPGNGYVVKVKCFDWYGDTRNSYARLYVVRYILNMYNEILGAEIKYQDNWIFEKITTKEVTDIRQNTAVCGGIVDENSGDVTERGICWKKDDLPTINDNHIYMEDNINDYEIRMAGLESSSRYLVRAYIKNSKGDVLYGNIRIFTTL